MRPAAVNRKALFHRRKHESLTESGALQRCFDTPRRLGRCGKWRSNSCFRRSFPSIVSCFQRFNADRFANANAGTLARLRFRAFADDEKHPKNGPQSGCAAPERPEIGALWRAGRGARPFSAANDGSAKARCNADSRLNEHAPPRASRGRSGQGAARRSSRAGSWRAGIRRGSTPGPRFPCAQPRSSPRPPRAGP